MIFLKLNSKMAAMRNLILFVCLIFTMSSLAQEKEESVSFKQVQEVPVYPGCTGDNQALRKCFTRKLQIHFGKNFNPGLINNSAFNSVNKKFFILFSINKEGILEDVQVKRAPHERLEKESKRVMSLFPKVIPGKIKGKPVTVKYVFPFSMKDKTNRKSNN